MKTISVIAILLCSCLSILAQNLSPIPKIDRQLAGYFSVNQHERVFVATDKQRYKPGETIWFTIWSSMQSENQTNSRNNELIVKLFDANGKAFSVQLLPQTSQATSGSIDIPENLTSGPYFLVAFISGQKIPDNAFTAELWIGQNYSNQLIANYSLKDPISLPGRKNELTIQLKYLSGENAKNTQIRYQLLNGTEVIEKDKLKTDESGNAILQFTLPEKSNGEPFMCELSDSKEEWKKELYLPTALDPITVCFYPEGGAMIQGMPSKIGFTAFNKWGIPVGIDGSVVDQEGKQVALVKTVTPGLGVFSLQPQAAQKLKLVILDGFGMKQSFDLPVVQTNGLAFSVLKTEPGFITIQLMTTSSEKRAIALTATSQGKLFWAADMEIEGNKRIKIPTNDLPQGVNQLSVFSHEGSLLAERLVFVEKSKKINVQIVPERSSLRSGESMKISVDLSDEQSQPAGGNFCVSVVDLHQKSDIMPAYGTLFLSGMALETPFNSLPEVFSGNNASPAMIDIFLMANKIKSFDWSTILNFKPDAANDYTTTNGIFGFVSDKNGAIVSKAKVSMVNNKTMRVLTTTTDSNGRFSFPDLKNSQKDDFAGKATDAEGKRELNITFSKDFDGQLSDMVASGARKLILTREDKVADEAYFRNNQELFQKAPRTSGDKNTMIDSQRRMLENSTSLMDVIKSIRPFRLMNNQIVFYGSENSINFQGGALIILDGQQMGTDVSVISSLSPTEVERINVSTNPMDIQRYTGLNSVGIIEIFRKNAGQSASNAKSSQTNFIEEKGPRVFQAEPDHARRDLRTTLQWIPLLATDEKGKAEFSVTASKVVSDFIIEIQGISTNGQPIYGTGRFSVIK